MPNAKLRCKSCKNYFPRETVHTGFCTDECRAAWRCRQQVKRPSQPRKMARQGNIFAAEFEAMRPAVHERSKGRCELRSYVCTGKAQHIHHRKLRSSGGSNDLGNLRDLCLACHNLVHESPAWSYTVGIMLHAWDDPSAITVDQSRYILDELAA